MADNDDETKGSAVFRESIAQMEDPAERAKLTKFADWADNLENTCVWSKKQPNTALHVRSLGEDRSLAIGFNWKRAPQLQRRGHVTLFYETFRDRAPDTLPAIAGFTGWELRADGKQLKRTKDVKDITDGLLKLLTKAYKEAAKQEA